MQVLKRTYRVQNSSSPYPNWSNERSTSLQPLHPCSIQFYFQPLIDASPTGQNLDNKETSRRRNEATRGPNVQSHCGVTIARALEDKLWDTDERMSWDKQASYWEEEVSKISIFNSPSPQDINQKVAMPLSSSTKRCRLHILSLLMKLLREFLS